MKTPHPCHITEYNPQTFVAKIPILFYNIKNSTNVDGIAFHLTFICYYLHLMLMNRVSRHSGKLIHTNTAYFLEIKGISRGPEALQNHLNDFYHTGVLCWPYEIINPWTCRVMLTFILE